MVPMDLNIEYWFPKFGFTFLGQIYNFCYLRPFCGEGCGMYFWEVYQRIIHPPMDVLLGSSDQWVMGFTTSLRWRSIFERKSGDHTTIELSKEEHPLQNKQQNKIRLSHNHWSLLQGEQHQHWIHGNLRVPTPPQCYVYPWPGCAALQAPPECQGVALLLAQQATKAIVTW